MSGVVGIFSMLPRERRMNPTIKYKKQEYVLRKDQDKSRKEWVITEVPFSEFEKRLKNFYINNYLLHNWIFQWQRHQQALSIKNMRPQWLVFFFDFAKKILTGNRMRPSVLNRKKF